MRLLVAVVLIIWRKIFVDGVPIDNGVEGDPEITCGPAFLAMKFHTQNPFGGHVYAKGRFSEAACRVDGDQSPQNLATFTVSFDTCGVRRSRSVNPKGILMTVTVLIMFHSRFMTKVDRAYYVQCFYMEAEKTVTAALDVSMIATTSLLAQAPMPACRYQVLDSKGGQPIRYAKVGDPVHHRWTCDATVSDTYCMVVHTCIVDDGSGNTVTLIDSNGSGNTLLFESIRNRRKSAFGKLRCAQDQYLLGNLEYFDDLTVGRDAHVFKYADKSTISFNCQISVAPRQLGLPCPRPSCPSLDTSSAYTTQATYSSAYTTQVPSYAPTYPSSSPTYAPAYPTPSPPAQAYTATSTLIPAPPAWIDRRSRRFQRSSFKDLQHESAAVDYSLYDGGDTRNESSGIIDVDTQSILVFDLDSHLDTSKLNGLLHDTEHSHRTFGPFCVPKSLFSLYACASMAMVVVSFIILSVVCYNRCCRSYPQRRYPRTIAEPCDDPERKQVFHSMYYRFFALRLPRRQ